MSNNEWELRTTIEALRSEVQRLTDTNTKMFTDGLNQTFEIETCKIRIKQLETAARAVLDLFDLTYKDVPPPLLKLDEIVNG